ncbi:MAG: hypothetical protein M5R36_23595 [Deltaproteobacteria bacterium]|nr:hypothetical protein [Deltaproteobacteria bacterium]
MFSLTDDEKARALDFLGGDIVIEAEDLEGSWFAKIPQVSPAGYRFLDDDLIAVFSGEDELLGLVGELKNHVEIDNETVLVDDGEVYETIENDLGLTRNDDLEVTVDETGIYYYGSGFTAAVLARAVADSGVYRYVIDAYSGTVLSASADSDEETAHGWVAAHEAAARYNEPAFLSSTQDAGNQLFLNDVVHVYDAVIDSDPNPVFIAAGTLAPNDTWFSKDYYNDRIASYAGGLYFNNDVPTADQIRNTDMSNFTVFYMVQQTLARFQTLGFVKDGRNYPSGHELAVVINKPSEDPDPPISDPLTFCSGGGSCFREEGFPRQAFDLHSRPVNTFDQCIWGVNCGTISWHPTMVLTPGGGYGAPTAQRYNLPLAHTVHEFTHYVQRRYYDRGTDDFQSNEETAIAEGTAFYFSASMTKQSPGNLYLDELRCYSNIDDVYSNPSIAFYERYYNCCDDEHNHGFVVSQALWDLERGWPAQGIPALGADYVQRAAFWAIRLGSSNQLINDFKNRMILATPLLLPCPAGPLSACVDAIDDAFAAHGVSDIPPIPLPDCTNCAGVRCFRDYDSCPAVTEGACHTGNSPDAVSCDAACTADVARCFSNNNVVLCRATCTQEMWSWETKRCRMLSSPNACISVCSQFGG